MSPQPSLSAYEFLPGFFKLAEDAWGIALVNLTALPQMFLLIASLLFIFTSFLNIHGPTQGVFLLKVGVMVGGVCLFLGALVACLSVCLAIVFPTIVSGIIPILPLMGLLILGGVLISTTHRVYDAAC